MGALAFVALRLVLKQLPLMSGRGSPAFAAAGYGLIMLAGAVMLIQSLRETPTGAHQHALTLGIGLLPCPLTISVLGFAWAQGTGLMVAVVLFALAFGIAFTIGTVAVLAITLRNTAGQALTHRLSDIEPWARAFQCAAGAAIVIIAAYSLWKAL